MEGRCPECGLAFAWADVLDRDRVDQRWFVEHAKTKWEMIRRTLPTLWLLMIPNRYWARLRFESRRSIKRYSLWILAIMILLHLISSIALVGASYGYTRFENAQYSFLIAQNPQMKAPFSGMMTKTNVPDYWWSHIGEALLYPIVNRSIFVEGYTSGAGFLANACIGISVMWFLLFCAFPTTRKRVKLRVGHVARAMVVAGSLPLLLIELARSLDAVLFVGTYWKPIAWVGSIPPTFSITFVVGVLVWVQWFWISAIRIGWKIKASWFELFLVMIASFFGLFLAGLSLLVFGLVGRVIEVLANWAGI